MPPEEDIEPGKEPDETSRSAMLPIEKNARRLVGVLVQHFPRGGICEDLRRQFEKDTSLRRQSFYNALKYAKEQGWIVGGGSPHNQNQLYNLNPDGSWKELASTGEGTGEAIGLDKDRLEYLVDSQSQQIDELQSKVTRLLDWTGSSDTDGENVALANLMQIIGDDGASVRQRLKAAGAILGYRVQDDSVIEFTKRFLQSVCVSADNIDYRIEASELLRRHEAPRVTPDSVRPSYRDDTPMEPPEPLMDLVARRRARADQMEREMAKQLAADMSDPDVLIHSDSGDDH